MRHVILAACLLAGCTEADHSSYETFELQPAMPTPLDLLVVLDDTTAMGPHLPRNPPPGQVSVPALFYNGAPDVRIAVTTTTTGTLRTSAEVPSGVIEHRLRFADGYLVTNYPGTLVDAVASLMNVGTTSTAPNAVLASTQQALSANFVRDSAALGVLIATAGDDQSPDAVESYTGVILARKQPTGISVVHAEPVPRLAVYANAFALWHTQPMAAYDMTSVEVFASLLTYPAQDSCFPIAPSDLASCEFYTSHERVARWLSMCLGSATLNLLPCWQLVEDTSCASGWTLLLGGGFSHYHPRIFGRCRTR
jgi:hypothetical protein